jgi:GDP-L-fucose synthase
MYGSAIVRNLKQNGFTNLILKDRKALDLMDLTAVKTFFEEYKPEYVFLAAAKVGGIQANIASPVDFFFDNVTIQNNVIHQAYLNGVKKLIYLGSSCIYPKECPQPMKEEYLLTGKLEPTNEGYALAKICGLKLLEYYHTQQNFKSISLMPCNLYGTNDSFHAEHAHVLSSLIRKFVDAVDANASTVEIWGTGIAMREFMHVDDAAEAAVSLAQTYDDPKFVNVGWGIDISIKDLVEMIRKEVDFEGEVRWDASKPNGMLKKCMDVSKMKEIGFMPKITLKEGIKQTIAEYRTLKQGL